jgi:KipI family sensor histidine kinase inhibitor
MKLAAFGQAAVLAEFAELGAALAAYVALSADMPAGVVELVPAARTVLVRFDPGRTTARRLAGELRTRAPFPPSSPTAEADADVEVPVCYDGADLAEVARLTRMTEADVVAAHTGAAWVVAFCGFSPGFGYLTCPDNRLAVPRRETPRTAVPAGSVGLAGEFTGVYPSASPGGWQLIGRTELPVWRLDRDPPALLSPGRRVRFTVAS